MKYCNQCGSAVSHQVPAGDTRPRHVCTACDHIHYLNPKVIAGCLPVYEDKVLLCKRAIEPRSGLWTLPAGFLENGETTSAGALRETQEEANANARIISLYTLFSLPHISQVYMFFRADLLDLNFSAGEESLDVQLFAENEIPWDEMAFPVMTKTLEHYFADRAGNDFPVRYDELIFPPRPTT